MVGAAFGEGSVHKAFVDTTRRPSATVNICSGHFHFRLTFYVQLNYV